MSALKEENDDYTVKCMHCTQTNDTCTGVDIQFYVNNNSPFHVSSTCFFHLPINPWQHLTL